MANRRVLLPVPHIAQEPELCVPTAAAMVLAYYGDERAPREIKTLAQGRDCDPEVPCVSPASIVHVQP